MKALKKLLASILALGMMVGGVACTFPGGGNSSTNSSTDSSATSSSDSSVVDTQLADKQTYLNSISTAFTTAQSYKLSTVFNYEYEDADGTTEEATISSDMIFSYKMVGAKKTNAFQLNMTIATNNSDNISVTMYLSENNLYVLRNDSGVWYIVEDMPLATLVENALTGGLAGGVLKAYAAQFGSNVDFDTLATTLRDETVAAANIEQEAFVLKSSAVSALNASANGNWYENTNTTSLIGLLGKQVGATLTAEDLATYMPAVAKGNVSFEKADFSFTAIYDTRYERFELIQNMNFGLDVEIAIPNGDTLRTTFTYNLSEIDDGMVAITVPSYDWGEPNFFE